ncbi:MAG: antibiotic biosynthesis monooxygenase family protein [Acidimicrobiales bacterium]
MAFGRIVFYPGGTEAQYRAVIDEIGRPFADVPERLFHTAGPTEGGWLMITIWQSKEAFDRWGKEHIGPAHQRAGKRGWQSQPETTDFETFHLLT